jgi:type VI protein secretion system component VasF
MTLLELCDPLFKYVCFVNRSERKGASIDPAQVDSDLETILSEIKAKAAGQANLADQYEKIEMDLIFFVDNVIATVPTVLGEQWNAQRLAYKRERLTGDDDFCIDMDETLAEPESVSSNERLAVYYTCLGLGFTGGMMYDPATRRQKMAQMARRVLKVMKEEDRTRITPQAYKYTLQDDLIPPPVGPIWQIVVALILLIGVLVVVNAYMYRAQLAELTRHLTTVQNSAVAAQQPVASSEK